jgi:hypothetical protein
MNTTNTEATARPTGKTAATQAFSIHTAITAWLTKHDDAITTGLFVAAVVLDFFE